MFIRDISAILLTYGIPLIALLIGYLGGWVFQKASKDPAEVKNWRSFVLAIVLGTFAASYEAKVRVEQLKEPIDIIAQDAILVPFIMTLDEAYSSHTLLGDIYRRHIYKHPEQVRNSVNNAKQLKDYVIAEDELPDVAVLVVDKAKQSIRATSYVEDDQWWNTSWGRTYLDANKRAVDRGVKIERFFIIPDHKSYEGSKSLLDANRKAGVTVYYIMKSELGDKFTKDVILVDDQFVGTLELEGRTINKISFNAGRDAKEAAHSILRIASTNARKYRP